MASVREVVRAAWRRNPWEVILPVLALAAVGAALGHLLLGATVRRTGPSADEFVVQWRPPG